MDPILIASAIFMMAVLFVGSVYFFIWELPEREKRKKVRDRLESISEAGEYSHTKVEQKNHGPRGFGDCLEPDTSKEGCPVQEQLQNPVKQPNSRRREKSER